MGSISDSIAEMIRKRAVSSTLGTYLFFWGVSHWQGIYTTFFVSQDLIKEKYGLLKNEYVSQYFFSWRSWDDWNFYLGYIIPVVLTYVFIWLIPKNILIYAYKEEQKHKMDKRIARFDEEKRLHEKEKEVATSSKDALQAEIEVSEKKKVAEEKDPTILWDSEYRDFKEDPSFLSFQFIIEAVYAHNGRTQDYNPHFQVPTGILATAHSNGLISINNNNNNTLIELTEKGRYFVSQYPQGR